MKIKKIRTDLPGWQKEARAAMLHQFAINEKVNAFFDKYNAESVERFVQNYIDMKISWYEHADYYERKSQDDEALWLKLASDQLPVIQQKKLFDVQCQWRAEQLVLPGVEICYDFVVSSLDILNCPFITPITAEDVDMYKQYLAKEDSQLPDQFTISDYDWQNYEELKESLQKDNGDIEFPGWYEYHNSCTGNQAMLLLPDIRGQKEEYYMEKWREFNSAEYEKKNKDIVIDKRPLLSVYDNIDEFIRKFDDIYTLRHYQNYQKTNQMNDVIEEYTDMVETLLNANITVPMQAHENWREGLRLTVESYQRKRIIEALDLAFEQYEMNRSMNIAFPPSGNQDKHMRELFTQGILTGRRLLGEPEDFNF